MREFRSTEHSDIFSTFPPLNNFAKSSILNVWQGSEYASGRH